MLFAILYWLFFFSSTQWFFPCACILICIMLSCISQGPYSLDSYPWKLPFLEIDVKGGERAHQSLLTLLRKEKRCTFIRGENSHIFKRGKICQSLFWSLKFALSLLCYNIFLLWFYLNLSYPIIHVGFRGREKLNLGEKILETYFKSFGYMLILKEVLTQWYSLLHVIPVLVLLWLLKFFLLEVFLCYLTLFYQDCFSRVISRTTR